jgi:hypothetical protein
MKIANQRTAVYVAFLVTENDRTCHREVSVPSADKPTWSAAVK